MLAKTKVSTIIAYPFSGETRFNRKRPISDEIAVIIKNRNENVTPRLGSSPMYSNP